MPEKVFIQINDEVIEANNAALDYMAAWKVTVEAEQEAIQAEQAAKIASRESALAKLAALGLTEDEIAAL
jgi:DNA-binding NarL/FixJ family response regulator